MPNAVRIHKGSATVVGYGSPDSNGYYVPDTLDRNSLRYLGDAVWVEGQPNGFELRYEPPALGSWTLPIPGMGCVNNVRDRGFITPFAGTPIRISSDATKSGQPPMCQIDPECQFGFAIPPGGVYDHGVSADPAYAIEGPANSMDGVIKSVDELSVAFNLPASATGADCGIAGMTCRFNHGNGNLVLSFELPGSGPTAPPLRFFYNSQVESQTEFGYGWSLLWNQWLADIDESESLGTVPLMRVTSPSGATWSLTRDDSSQLTSIADPSGGVTSFAYDTDRLTAITDAAGRVSSFEMNSTGDLTRVLVAAHAEMLFHYDGNRALTGVQSADGAVTSFAYDSLRRLTGITRPGGAQTNIAYASGTCVVTDPRSGTWTLQTDHHRNTTRVVTPAGTTLGYAWHGATERPASFVDGAGAVTSFSFTTMNDHSSRLTRMAEADGATLLGYDIGDGRLTSITDKLGLQSSLSWAAGQRTTYVDEASETTTYEYDPQGQLTSAVQPLGQTWSWQYDAAARLTAAIDPLQSSRTFVYDALSQVTLVTDEEGVATTLTVDPLNRVTRTIDTGQGTRTTAFDAAGRTTRVIDPLGRTTTCAYDAAGNLTASIDPSSATTGYRYDLSANRTLAIDGRGLTTVTGYDTINRHTSTVSPLGVTETFAYDLASNRTLVVDARGNFWQWAYDAIRRATLATDPQNHQSSRRIDPAGNTTTKTDQAGNEQRYEYDKRGRMTRHVDEQGYTTDSQYDPNNRKTAVVKPQGVTKIAQYDDRGRVTQTHADGRATLLAYDRRSDVTETVRPGGETIAVRYNAWRLPGTRVDALGATTTWHYDAGRQLTQTISPTGGTTQATTQAQYDPSGRRTLNVDADGVAVSSAFDAAGNLTALADARGASGTFHYDAGNRRTREVWSDGVTLQFAFDAAGNRTLAAGPSGTATAEYDSRNLLTATTDPNKPSLSATIAYDARGLRTTLTAYDDGHFAFGYDTRGLQTRVIRPGGRSAVASYDGLRRVTDTVHAGGARSTVSYSDEDVTAIDQYDGSSNLVNAISLQYDLAGRRTLQSESDGTETRWGYDITGQLTGEHCTRTSSAVYDVKYGYDLGGRRTQVVDGGVTAIALYTAAGRVTETADPGATTTFHYAAGLRTTRIADTLTTVYQYDARARLRQVDLPGDTIAYTVDADARIARRTSTASGETWNVYDGTRLLAETDDTGITQKLYVHLGDALVWQDGVAGLADLLSDAWGNVNVIGDDTGATSGPYRYRRTGLDPAGLVAGGADNAGNPISDITAFGFGGSAGVLLDAETQLYLVDGTKPDASPSGGWWDPLTLRHLGSSMDFHPAATLGAEPTT